MVLSYVRQVISDIDDFSQRSIEAVVKEHGGLLKYTSLKDLIDKVGGTVDRAALQSLFEQLAALHTTLYAAKNQEVAQLLREVDKYLERLLIITEGHKKDLGTGRDIQRGSA